MIKIVLETILIFLSKNLFFSTLSLDLREFFLNTHDTII